MVIVLPKEDARRRAPSRTGTADLNGPVATQLSDEIRDPSSSSPIMMSADSFGLRLAEELPPRFSRGAPFSAASRSSLG